MPGKRADQAAHHTLQRRYDRDHAQQAQDPQRPEHGEGRGGGSKRDADDRHVENIPAVAEEGAALHGEPAENLDDEDANDQAVDDGEQRAVALHHGGAGLQAERDRVDEDQHEDDALGPRTVNDLTQPIHDPPPRTIRPGAILTACPGRREGPYRPGSA